MSKSYDDFKLNFLCEKYKIPLSDYTIDRRNMPQIHLDQYEKLKEFLKEQGISSKNTKIKAEYLKRIQSKIDQEKIKSLLDNSVEDLQKSQILISKDYYMLDGNHRGVALLNKGKGVQVNVFMLDLDVKEALEKLKNFSTVLYKDDDNVEYIEPEKGMKMEDFSFKEIYESRKNNENEKITVEGMGTVSISNAKRMVSKYLKDMEKQEKSGNYRGVLHYAQTAHLIPVLEALTEVQEKNGD